MIEEAKYTDPTIEVCTPEDFDENFKSGLEHDDKLLSELVSDWNKITSDPKLELFITDYLNGIILFPNSSNKTGLCVVQSTSTWRCRDKSFNLTSNEIYGGTFNLFGVTLKKLGIECTFVNPNDSEEEIDIFSYKSSWNRCFGSAFGNFLFRYPRRTTP